MKMILCVVALAFSTAGCGLWWERVEHLPGGATSSTPDPAQRVWWHVVRATYAAESFLREALLCRALGHDWHTYPAGWGTRDGRYRTATIRMCPLGRHHEALVWSEWRDTAELPAVVMPNGLTYRPIIHPDGRVEGAAR